MREIQQKYNHVDQQPDRKISYSSILTSFTFSEAYLVHASKIETHVDKGNQSVGYMAIAVPCS